MANKADDQIEGGLHERDQLYKDIEDLKKEVKKLNKDLIDYNDAKNSAIKSSRDRAIAIIKNQFLIKKIKGLEWLEDLLAPVPPDQRKQFIMNAVMEESIASKQRHYLIDVLHGELDLDGLREFLDQRPGGESDG